MKIKEYSEEIEVEILFSSKQCPKCKMDLDIIDESGGIRIWFCSHCRMKVPEPIGRAIFHPQILTDA